MAVKLWSFIEWLAIVVTFCWLEFCRGFSCDCGWWMVDNSAVKKLILIIPPTNHKKLSTRFDLPFDYQCLVIYLNNGLYKIKLNLIVDSRFLIVFYTKVYKLCFMHLPWFKDKKNCHYYLIRMNINSNCFLDRLWSQLPCRSLNLKIKEKWIKSFSLNIFIHDTIDIIF